MRTFKAVLSDASNGQPFKQSVTSLPLSFLKENEVEIEVLFSSLNYKDALSAFGKNNVTKSYPHITGIDAAGRVVSDKTNTFKTGEEVIVTGYDLGMNTYGGHATILRVPAAWVVRKPHALSLYEAMCFGTAGFTVGLAWHKMQPYVETIKKGDFLITGASGGVGSFALSIFSQEGIRLVAASSKKNHEQTLTALGASSVVHPKDILVPEEKPLVKPRWSGALDNLGGHFMRSILASTQKEGCVVSIGLAASMDLHTTILPFILNGIHLLGINSADTPSSLRTEVWHYLAKVKTKVLADMNSHIRVISLEEISHHLQAMLAGDIRGRIVVDVAG